MLDMRDQLAKLYELQRIDTGIAARRQTLRELDDGSGADAKLQAAQVALASQEEQFKGLEASMRDRELELKSTEAEKATRTKQAYSVTDAKQATALGKKVEELARHQGKLEEDILALMDQVEAAQTAAAKQRAAAEVLDKRAQDVKGQFATGSEKMKRELKSLKHAREELAAQVDPPLLKQYEDILAKAAGLAVAAVHKGSCAGCKVTIPSMVSARLRMHNQLVKCDNCHRFLYLPEGESAYKPEDDR